MTCLTNLPDRGVITINGADRAGFLQGLVSNDVNKVASGHAAWSALLTPQGRYFAEFFILTDGDTLFLDAPKAIIADLVKRLSRFRLRAKAELADVSARWQVYAGWNGPLPAGTIAALDPRLGEAGFRLLAETPVEMNASQDAYLAHRLRLGLPDHADLEPDKTLLLEAGFDELHGIAWDKGCYMGQELTARTRYRGLVKRRLVPVAVQGPLPAPGMPIMNNGREAGTMRSGLGTRGLAMLRLDALDTELVAGETILYPDIPAWMRLPEHQEAKPVP